MLCQEDILLVGKHSLAVFLEVISSCFAVVLVTIFTTITTITATMIEPPAMTMP